MTQEILAKIMGIAARTGDRVIVVDPATGAPFTLISLDQYEKLLNQAEPQAKPFEVPVPGMRPLTASQGSGMIDSAFTPWKTAVQSVESAVEPAEVEEDRYYMEPTE